MKDIQFVRDLFIENLNFMSFEMKNFRRKRSEIENIMFSKDVKFKSGREIPSTIQFDIITEKENLRLLNSSLISKILLPSEVRIGGSLLQQMTEKEKKNYVKGKLSPESKSVFSEEEQKLYTQCNRLLGKNLEMKSNIDKIVPTLMELKRNFETTEDILDKSKLRVKEILIQKSKMAFEIDEKLIELRKLIKKKENQFVVMQKHYIELQKRRQLMSSQSFKTLKERVK